jgi:hypothetical protein
MTEFKIVDLNVATIIEMVYEMKSMGYVIDKDFSFAYHLSKGNAESSVGHVEWVQDRHVLFTVYNESLVSLFALKWAEYL